MLFFSTTYIRKQDVAIAAGIVLVHGLLSILGFPFIPVEGHLQLAQTHSAPGTSVLQSIWWFHGNPPLLSAIHALASGLVPGRALLFFQLLLPFLHAASFLLFVMGIRRRGLLFPTWLVCILFLNPLIFIYFRYPFYTCFLFFASCLVWVLLASHAKNPWNTTYRIAWILGVASLLRASWHPLLFLPGLYFLLPKPLNWRYIKLLLPFVPVLLWMGKNQALVGRFTTSTWLGINLYRTHHAWDQHRFPIDFLPVFSKPDSAFALLVSDKEVQNCRNETRPPLCKNNMNHSLIPVLADRYLESLVAQFSATWSAQAMLNGFLFFFQSPGYANHISLTTHKADGVKSSFLNPDWLDPILRNSPKYIVRFWGNKGFDPGQTRLRVWNRVSIYTLVYPFLLVWFLVNRKLLPVADRVLLSWLIAFCALYISVDVLEANRMRMEVEPWFWAFGVMFWSYRFAKNKTDEAKNERANRRPGQAETSFSPPAG